MRHHNINKKFGRKRDARKALMRSLAIALIQEEKIETTEVKAKAVRRYAEKLVTKAKKGDLSARRLIASRLGSGGGPATQKLMDDLAVRFKDRNGGYTRVVKLGNRIGSDGAAMAIVEFVEA